MSSVDKNSSFLVPIFIVWTRTLAFTLSREVISRAVHNRVNTANDSNRENCDLGVKSILFKKQKWLISLFFFVFCFLLFFFFLLSLFSFQIHFLPISTLGNTSKSCYGVHLEAILSQIPACDSVSPQKGNSRSWGHSHMEVTGMCGQDPQSWGLSVRINENMESLGEDYKKKKGIF